MEYNSNEFKEYVSGTSDIVVAAITYSMEQFHDSLGNTDTKEIHDVCGDMRNIASREYNDRHLHWSTYETEDD